MRYLLTEDTGAGLHFWKLVNQLFFNDALVVESKESNQGLLDAVLDLNIKEDNKYYIAFDYVVDNQDIRNKYRMLKSITDKSDGKIVILDMICFEYLILAFDKLVEWTGTGKTDKIKIREKVLGVVENHRIDLSRIDDEKTLQYIAGFKRYSTERVMKSLVGEFTQNEKWSVKGTLMGECWYKDCCVSEHTDNLRCGKPEVESGDEKMRMLIRSEKVQRLMRDIPNTIVIMAVGSKQLENSVKKIFGNAVDTGRYLRKFISFNLELGVGELQSKYVERYNYYFEKFEERDAAAEELQTLATLCQIDIRNLNKLIEKLDIIHTLAFKGKMSESVLWFELMWGMIKYKISLPDKEGKYSDRSDDLYWLPEIDHATYGGLDNYLSKDIIEYLKEKKNIAMTHTRITGMNSEEIMVSNDFNGEAWHILDQLLARKKTLYMNPVNQTVDIDECKKFIEFAKILW